MKKIIYFICIVVLLFSPFSVMADKEISRGEKIISEMQFEKLNFTAPKPDRYVLDNGMVVYLMEYLGSGIVNVEILVRVGGIYDPAGKSGLAGLLGDVINLGGIREDSDGFNEYLDNNAISLNVTMNMESGVVSSSFLTEDTNQGLSVIFEVVTASWFNDEVVELAKNQAGETIRRERDKPKKLRFHELRKLIYETFPYSDNGKGTPESIDNINVQDLVKFHSKYFRPQNVILGISGDFRTKEMLNKVEELFGVWKGKTDLPNLPKLDAELISANPGVFFVPKEKRNQSAIVMGHIGRMYTPDQEFFQLKVMQRVFGGSMTSRINMRIRGDEGLAYGARGGFAARYNYKGFFYTYTDTKSSSTVDAINIFLEEIDKIKTDDGRVTIQEIRDVQDTISSSFIFNFDSKSSILNQSMNSEYNGDPDGWMDNYLDNLRKVDEEDVLRVARKYLHPDQLTILVVGNPEILPDLEREYGKVTIIDIHK